jgi:lipopolysaccharide transport system permease protein
MNKDDWDLVIDSKPKKTSGYFRELIRYKDLILMFVKRDFISLYKQTILGPLWVIIQPILTTITFTIVFGNIAKIDTGAGVPPILFYLIGVTTWTYFSDCVTKTSETFISNQNIFGKVYFPRLVVPLSLVITNLIKFGIQIALFLVIYIFYMLFPVDGQDFNLNTLLFITPILVLTMATLGLGTGLIITSLTTKYRDLRFLIQFGIQLVMYATPVVYPLNNLSEKYQFILHLNPMTNIIESFKCGFFGPDYGVFDIFWLAYSIIAAILIFALGIRLFNRVEKTFMDTI